VQGWLLARDLSVSVAAALFSLWVAFAAGYSAVYQAMVVVLVGIILYAFIRAHEENTGRIPAPVDLPAGHDENSEGQS
jgi:basic amino acid/polyamine antiporter, APA family